ncbi:hypothetical protein Q7A53_05840 [Halobacillus rhizosphaerae]|uniref:hypothetical protein n=1 Tax=Halobacillus rhizosphaerae TaxID=3064889 RepID=UPI00398AA9A0
MLKFNGVELTDETIQKTRKWFHNNCMACIEEVKSGKVYVNNIKKYIEMEKESARDYMEGKNDYIFAFVQRAYYIQTGECIALLPK